MDLMDMILSDSSPEEISDKIKELLFTRSSEKIDSATPYVARAMFDSEDE
jgi:hypothetical protein